MPTYKYVSELAMQIVVFAGSLVYFVFLFRSSVLYVRDDNKTAQ